MAFLDHIRKQIGSLVAASDDEMAPYAAHQQPSFSSREGASLSTLTPKKIPQNSSDSIPGFEQVYKTAYTHGLEAIYTLENVDLKTVRRLQEAPTNPPTELLSKKTIRKDLQSSEQLEFDFGDSYRGWMESFMLEEPIHVLKLTSHAEKLLLEHGKEILKDVVAMDIRDFVFLKGMGQGHIDEIRQKIHQYTQGRSLDCSYTVDFASLLRGLFRGIERKKIYVMLDQYQLSYLVSLSAAENAEVRQLAPERRLEWIQDLQRELSSDKKQVAVQAKLHRIATVFLKPWIRRRMGVVSHYDLEERLLMISEDSPAVTEAILFFLNENCCGGRFPFLSHVFPVEEQLYCSESHIADDFFRILEAAHRYFYQPNLSYSLPHLVSLLKRECAKSWKTYPDGFIEKVLRHSRIFRVRKGDQGKLWIKQC